MPRGPPANYEKSEKQISKKQVLPRIIKWFGCKPYGKDYGKIDY
tara:strand:+ start:379 stop:510 length:132 start_codon:yes stop_codon:yes gene_type:complete